MKIIIMVSNVSLTLLHINVYLDHIFSYFLLCLLLNLIICIIDFFYLIPSNLIFSIYVQFEGVIFTRRNFPDVQNLLSIIHAKFQKIQTKHVETTDK